MPSTTGLRAWLDDHVNLERGVGIPAETARATAPTLERIEALLELLGRPQDDLSVIHITGTNGKTSTARMCISLLSALGLRVGGYTSPHLERVNERITLDGEPVADGDLDDLLELVRLVEGHLDEPPSYFEILTAAALRHFADAAVDAAVVEVGLGGTWDATNVVDGRVAVVTNVSIDHVEYLGTTRTEIATEKAGIVKPASHLVLGETDPELRDVFATRSRLSTAVRGVDFGVRRDRVAVGGRLIDLYVGDAVHEEIFLPLHGAHQADNAAISLAAVEAFTGRGLHSDVVEQGFRETTAPGRLEVVGRAPLVLLDGAHNAEGAATLVRALAEEFAGAPRTLVVGLLAQKDPAEMLEALGALEADQLILVRPPSPRGRDPDDLADAAEALGVARDVIEVAESVRAAVGAAMLVTPDDGQIVVTGTLYLVGAARAILSGPRAD